MIGRLRAAAFAPVDLESITRNVDRRVARSPLAGHELQGGWGFVAFPFDSGHVLALRVAEQTDFAPYTSIWHRSPDGSWSIYVDGPRLDIACPRYWGTATDRLELTDIAIEWTGPRELRVEMAAPRLQWTATMTAGPLVRAINALGRRLPERVLRWGPAIRVVEQLCEHRFDLGDVTLAMAVPNGQDAVVLTRGLYFVEAGRARLDGEDLGAPAAGPDTPTFGEARLPARPVFTIGRAYLTILDDEEYEATIEEVRRGTPAADGPSLDRWLSPRAEASE